MQIVPSFRSATLAALLFCLALLASPTMGADEKKPAEEPTQNPRFTHCIKFKTGSTITMTGEVDAGGQKMQVEVKTTLVEVTKESVTVERVVKMNIGGRDHSQPAQKEVLKAAPTGDKMKVVGDEEVT